MKNSDHLVSILLPVYNASYFVKDSLQSLRSQTHKNIEIIVIDDKSTDQTYKILKTFKEKDPRIRLYRNKKHYGLAVTLNRAVKKVKGQFIAFMGAKDTCERKRIRTQLEFLLGNPKVVGVGTQCIFIDKKNKNMGKSMFPLEHEEIAKTLLSGISLLPLSAMINRKLLPKDVIKFRQNPYPFIYTDVLLKFLPYGQFANIKKRLYLNRKKRVNFDDAIKTYIPSFIKLWLKSYVLSDYQPTLRSLFIPLIKQI